MAGGSGEIHISDVFQVFRKIAKLWMHLKRVANQSSEFKKHSRALRFFLVSFLPQREMVLSCTNHKTCMRHEK